MTTIPTAYAVEDPPESTWDPDDCFIVCEDVRVDEPDPEVCPRPDGTPVDSEEMLALTSGYIQRAVGEFPRQGTREPWRAYQNYLRDIVMVRYGKLTDEALEFSRPAPRVRTGAEHGTGLDEGGNSGRAAVA